MFWPTLITCKLYFTIFEEVQITMPRSMRRKDLGKHKMYAFCKLQSEEDAAIAYERLQGKRLFGRLLTVEYANFSSVNASGGLYLGSSGYRSGGFGHKGVKPKPSIGHVEEDEEENAAQLVPEDELAEAGPSVLNAVSDAQDAGPSTPGAASEDSAEQAPEDQLMQAAEMIGNPQISNEPSSQNMTTPWLWNWDELHNQIWPTATRTLIMVRHGDYRMMAATEEEMGLTELGKRQIWTTAKRLSEIGCYNSLVSSTMKRSRDSADILSSVLNLEPQPADPLLREGMAVEPEPNLGRVYTVTEAETERIERAFSKYIHRASVDQSQDSREILTFHANVIRYFVARALQWPKESWLRINLPHASITTLVIRPNGRVSLHGLGEAGHLPLDLLET